MLSHKINFRPQDSHSNKPTYSHLGRDALEIPSDVNAFHLHQC